MTMALSLIAAGDINRTIWLFDTFAGMTRPTDADYEVRAGVRALPEFLRLRTGTNQSSWCEASLDEVTENMRSTGYPWDRIRMVQGPVEQTLLTERPERIALLRLDTDWYESTRVEMEHLFPLISSGGVLIVDDYNHWAGSRRAVDEYLVKIGLQLMFFPVGGGSVMAVVP